jgi:undecaprenyl-phosphate 4-deoxy-4-formamido-L-arabinose transferase
MSGEAPMISVVIPVFNEEATIDELYTRTVKALEERDYSFEFVMVDDGSSDASLQILQELRAADPRLRIIRLSRNFGQSPALYAGFSQARGQYVVMLDADLQNYPEDIPVLIDKLEEGYDMVSGWRVNRRDSFFRRLSSRGLNAYIAAVTKVKLHDYGCSLKAFRRELVGHMGTLTHRCRYLPVDVAGLGGHVAEVEVRHQDRSHGESKYGLYKLIRTAVDLLTSINAFPLQLISMLGLTFGAFGFLMGIRVAYVRLTQSDVTIVSYLGGVTAVFFVLAGIQLTVMGLMCEYVSRIYVEVQRKPYYIIRDELE